jgi:hypothetical protein
MKNKFTVHCRSSFLFTGKPKFNPPECLIERVSQRGIKMMVGGKSSAGLEKGRRG